MLCLALLAIIGSVLHDLEGEPPLFNVQNSGTHGNQTYYLCYLYPRPEYWVSRIRNLMLGKQ